MCIRDDHRYCQEVPHILEVAKKFKSSTAISHIERDFKGIDDTFEKIKSDITNNISDINKQKIKILSDISDTRKSLNDHLEKIEKQTVSEEQNLQVQLNNVLVAMKTKKTDFDDIRQNVNNTMKYASDLQIVLAENDITRVVDGEVKKQKGAFNYDLLELKLDFPPELKSCVKDISKFGVVSVSKKHCSTSLTTGAELEAHISLPQLTRKTSVNFQARTRGRVCINGCDILPNGKLVFAEQQGQLLLMFSNNGNYEKDMVRFSGIPFEVSYIGENIVAVAIWDKHEVVFVNVIANRIINTVNIGHECFGTDFTMDRLAIQTLPVYTSSHIVYLDPTGRLLERVNISNGFSRNISLRDGTIKCTDQSRIYCYTLTGQQKWTFKDEHVLRKPVGIALDKHYNVYVAGKETNNVVVLSPDGTNCRQILTESDGLKEPSSLRINIDRNELLVCNLKGPAFLFSLD